MVGLLGRKLGALVCALGLSACGDGLASSDNDAPAGADEGGTGEGFGTAGSTPEGDESSTGDDDDDDAVDETGTGGEPEEDDQGADDTCKADCGPDGYCDFDADGHPVCVCGEGSVPAGLRCLPCDETNGPHDVAIEGVFV